LYEIYDFYIHDVSPFQGLITYILGKISRRPDSNNPKLPPVTNDKNRELELADKDLSRIYRLISHFNVDLRIYTKSMDGTQLVCQRF
jgi:hypothetical protein